MGPVSAEIEIDVPREEAFEAIADLARRPAFTDHFLTGFHLTRIESSGVGAGARFRVGPRRRSVWMDTDDRRARPPPQDRRARPRRARATGSRRPRSGSCSRGRAALTQVRVSHWTEPANPVDRALEALSGTARWQERRWREALRRLRDLLESGGPPPGRVAVAAGNRHETGIP